MVWLKDIERNSSSDDPIVAKCQNPQCSSEMTSQFKINHFINKYKNATELLQTIKTKGFTEFVDRIKNI